ncbi:cytochrome P450 [Aspergillus undulatus]|uniref:cytochrome P450 n=1 Tax=Aspergillus undulatus TaxID=1810928 RepID=UPI003CCE2F7B
MSPTAVYSIPMLPDAVPVYAQFLGIGVFLLLGYYIYSTLVSERPLPGFPVATFPGTGLGPKESYFKDTSGTIAAGLRSYSGPFQLLTGTGPKIVLPHKYADELRNRPELDFNEAFRKDFFAHYPGFDGFRASLDNPSLIPSMLRMKLTQSLGLVTNHLVDEATVALKDLYGEEKEWRSVLVKQANLNFVARLSSRVFLGRPICRNTQWLEIAKNHTVDSFLAARDLRAQPFFLRPIMHYFMPHNKNIQQHYTDAKRIIETEVERRRVRAEVTLASGGKPPKVSDAIGWMVEVAAGKKGVDYVAAQLSLTVAAIHATTEALTVALLDLVTYPEAIPQLRREVIEVLGGDGGGWSKQALYRMKLMDSFLKESQRLHPPSDVSMNRKVMRRLTLSDGTTLPRGARLMVAGNLRDPAIYPNPDTFDPSRFLKLREGDSKNSAHQYVSTSAEMFAFGHGRHACPGRFLASSELKIALAHMILKYDWKLDESDTAPRFFENETAHMTNPMLKLMLRRRKEEINLDLDVDPDLLTVEE